MATLYDILEQHKKSKADKRVFGLVLQGGGMRAAYAAGAVVPLIQYEFTNAFEHVVGSSAGAINGAYFIDKHLETKDAYMYDLSNKNFVNLLRSEKKIDIDYAVDTVLKQKYPLNISNLNRAHAKLHTVLTDAKTGKLVVISDHKKFAEIYEELRATAAIPILYDKSVIVGGTYYVDGGVAARI
jgi:predicted patatin/cPLA2 family phospholipase